MNMSYKGKVALVTGAAEGMGFSTAKAFAEAGASVVLADKQADKVCASAIVLSRSFVEHVWEHPHKVKSKTSGTA